MKWSGIDRSGAIGNWIMALICGMACSYVSANDSGLMCTVNDEGEQAQFVCLDVKARIAITQNVDYLTRAAFSNFLEEQGVEILEPTEYFKRALWLNLKEFQQVGVVENCSEADGAKAQKVFYRLQEMASLANNQEVLANIKKLASALKSAGVCGLALPTGKYRNIRQIDIRTRDDILQHFLCISNSESVFGLQNIGQGGRGPFGINPTHTLEGALCDVKEAKKAIVRDGHGNEIKKSERYITDHTVLDANAKCATILYEKVNFFTSWGDDSVDWGSNRHCSGKVRRKINFPKLIGQLACCSDACKKEATQSKSF